MKKLFVVGLLSVLLLSGCGKSMNNTPEEAVEEYLNGYQMRNSSVIEKLEEWMMDQDMDDEMKKDYQNSLEKQYQNLSYEIIQTDEEEDSATVEVEIKVLDYQSSFQKSREYFLNHQEEFMENVVEEQDIDNLKEFMEYKIKELSGVEDMATYRIVFELEKNGKDWEVQEIDRDTFLKLYGLY